MIATLRNPLPDMEASRAHVRLEAPYGHAPSGYRGLSDESAVQKAPGLAISNQTRGQPQSW